MNKQESKFRSRIVKDLEQDGYCVFYFTNPIYQYGRGLPDLIAFGHDEVLFLELKTDDGRLSKDQKYILELIEGAKRVRGDWIKEGDYHEWREKNQLEPRALF